MMGKSHVITNTMSAVLLASAAVFAYNSLPAARGGLDIVTGHFKNLSIPEMLMCPVLFYGGTLAPDLDQKRGSGIRKYLYIPVEHRTYTHTLWACLLLFALSYFYVPAFFFALGYFLHIFWDSLSVGGIAWLYPMTGYRKYGSGAKIKTGHVLKFYRTGDISEKIVLVLLGIITFVIVALLFWYGHFGRNSEAIQMIFRR